MEWTQIRPDGPEAGCGPTAPSPGPRDIWGGSFSYGSALCILGGLVPYAETAEHGTVKALNDQWSVGVPALGRDD